MIESCSKRRMLLAIVCLGGLRGEEGFMIFSIKPVCKCALGKAINLLRLTLIVLVVESNWTEQGSSHSKSVNNSTKTDHCWQTESFEIIEPCHPCTEFEVASQSVKACIPTHFKEIIKCHVSGTTQRSCTKVKWIEERKYWMFEIIMFVLAVMSYSVVYLRQRVLDRRVLLKIQRQLANGLVS